MAQIAIGSGSFRRAAAPFAESRDFNNAHVAIERQGHDIADAQRMARRGEALAIQADVTGFDQRRGAAPRPHDARMPQPLIDALTIQRRLRLLFAFELLLECGQFRERRIGIRRLVAAA